MAESQKSPFVGEKDAVARPASKVTLHEIATGRVTEVWPIDARELVSSGEYAYGAPAPAEEKAAESSAVVGSIGTSPSGSEPLSDAEFEAQFEADLAAAEKAELEKQELEKAAADKAAADAAAAGSGSAPTAPTTTSRRRTSTTSGS